jgi:glycosyltransferase involved in cell wall biosynthesis
MARILMISPLPPAPTGVATYTAEVLRQLRAAGATARHEVRTEWPVTARTESVARNSDLVVYHLGNNVEHHRHIYDLSIRLPGLIVLHDLALDGLVWGLTELGDPLGDRSRREAQVAMHRLEREAGPLRGPLRVPWSAHAVRRARGVIVHAEYCRRYLRAAGCRTPVYVVPHPPLSDAWLRRPPPRSVRRALRTIRSRPGTVLVGVLGDINPAKRIDVVVEALDRLGDAPVHLAVVGRRIPDFSVEGVIPRGADRITVAADVSDPEFLGWLQACDIVVNLRDPHRGEVSGTLMRTLQAGVPTIVSGVGTYLDWPEDAVVRLGAGPPDPGELALALEGLIRDPVRRAEIGERARALMREEHDRLSAAHGYGAAIDGTLRLLRDPTRAGLGRWASSLAEMGATPDLVAQGHGVRYARGLQELASAGSR